MKKIISLLLAMIMVFSLATVAAADETTMVKVDTSKAETAAINLYKLYVVNGEDDPENDPIYPDETLTFTSEGLEGWKNPDPDVNLTVQSLLTMTSAEADGGDKTGKTHTLLVDIPAFSVPGLYKFVITENPGATQAVSYSEEEMYLNVLVTYDYGVTEYDEDGKNYQLKAQIVVSADSNMVNPGDATHHTPATGENNIGKYKLDTFTNTYDLGSLTVGKTISGNLADETAVFDITVTFTSENPVASDIDYTAGTESAAGTILHTAWTAVADKENANDFDYTASVVLKLKGTASVTFTDIPAGITYRIEENERHLADGSVDPNSPIDEDYTATYTNQEGTIVKETNASASVNNEKKTSVETGIALDSAPYFVILAVAMFGMVALVSKKRYEV